MKDAGISLHRDELKTSGIELMPSDISPMPSEPHRDDHYMFVVQRSGTFTWEVDFNKIKLKGPALCMITPGQAHHYLGNSTSRGWLLFADAALIAAHYRELLDTLPYDRPYTRLRADDLLFTTIGVLEQLLAADTGVLKKQVTQSLMDTISGMAAARLIQTRQHGVGTQKYTLAMHFRQLVKKHYRENKQVKEYADQLHITPLYLNEVMKTISGLTASYWIHQEIILEAKRLLYYTDLDVKEIAYALGYEDYAYFSRFFKNHSGMTASAFRAGKP